MVNPGEAHRGVHDCNTIAPRGRPFAPGVIDGQWVPEYSRLMRRHSLLSLLLICTISPVSALGAESKAAKAADVVKAAELSRFEAAQKNDLETLTKLLADDLTYTHSTGRLETKAAFLDSLKTGKLQFKTGRLGRFVSVIPDDAA